MIVEFFGRGRGAGSGPVDYLLGKNRDREKAEVLRGNPDETAAIIDSSAYAKKYTSGCLSFEESHVGEAKKRELMDSFEECLFPNMDKSQYNVLWVEHRDKGRLELNFVIPNIELETGKRLQPYYHNADLKRVDAWRTIQNIENGFSDPDDPAKRQTLVSAKDLPTAQKEAVTAINDGLTSLVQQGAITSRQELISTLEKGGFEIARQTKSSISIKNPEGGRNIRLKGAMYEQDFRFSQDLQGHIEQRSREHKQRVTERLGEAKERYSYGIERRAAELERRYPPKQPSVNRSPGGQLERVAERHLQKPSQNELEPFQNVGLGRVLSNNSLELANALGALSGRGDLAPVRGNSRNQGNLESVGGQDIRDHYQELFDGGRQQQAVRGSGHEVHQFSLGQRQEKSANDIEDKINDRSREVIARIIKENEERANRSRESYRSRLGAVGQGTAEQRAENYRNLAALRRTAEKDRSANTDRLAGLGAESGKTRELERAGRFLGAAKHATKRAFGAVEQLVSKVKVKIRALSPTRRAHGRDSGFSR